MSARISSMRVPKEFKELVMRESKSRALSVKELIVKAVQHYAAEPLEGMDRSITVPLPKTTMLRDSHWNSLHH